MQEAMEQQVQPEELPAQQSVDEVVQPAAETTNQAAERTTTDIFHWANTIDAVKNELEVEFFLFSKKYTPYSTRLQPELEAQVKPLFLLDYLAFVTRGAGVGLTVHDYDHITDSGDSLLRVNLEQVGRAETLLYLIEKERHDIMEFSEEEHEFKRMKGVIARFYLPDQPEKTFYVIKQLQQNQVLHGATAWEFKDGTFGQFTADVGLKIPADNQVLVVGQDIFAFNQKKFESLFQYEYKRLAIASEKTKAIESTYRLTFPEGIRLEELVREKKKLVTKLQTMEIGAISQAEAIDYADEMQLDLMVDDDGAIIIMDSGDLDVFLNVINEDYVTSQITGRRFEIKSKRLLDEPEGEAPSGLAGGR